MNWITLVIAVFVSCVLMITVWYVVEYAFVVLGLITKTRKPKKKTEPKKKTGKECYLMLSTHRPPFQYYGEYKNRKEMEEAQMNIWRRGEGAKEVTKEEYETWLKEKD